VQLGSELGAAAQSPVARRLLCDRATDPDRDPRPLHGWRHKASAVDEVALPAVRDPVARPQSADQVERLVEDGAAALARPATGHAGQVSLAVAGPYAQHQPTTRDVVDRHGLEGHSLRVAPRSGVTMVPSVSRVVAWATRPSVIQTS
jgi:hypothetical protein